MVSSKTLTPHAWRSKSSREVHGDTRWIWRREASGWSDLMPIMYCYMRTRPGRRWTRPSYCWVLTCYKINYLLHGENGSFFFFKFFGWNEWVPVLVHALMSVFMSVQFVMVVLKGSLAITFGGNKDPAVYAEIISMGGITRAVKKELISTLGAILQDKLSVPPARFILKVFDTTAHRIYSKLWPEWRHCRLI